MAGYLLADDAVEARKRSFDEWIAQQQQSLQQSAQNVRTTLEPFNQPLLQQQPPATAPLSPATPVPAPVEDPQVEQRRARFQAWIDQQQQAAPPTLTQSAPLVQQAAPSLATAQPEPPEVAQRRQRFQSWVDQQQQAAVPTLAQPAPTAPTPLEQRAESPEVEQRRQRFQAWVDQQQPGGQPAPVPATPAEQAAAPAVAAPAQAPTGQLSQFGDASLSNDEAYAACGPAAAVRFAQAYGRNPSLREATDLAASVGWTSQQGMAGLSSEKALMDKLGISTRAVGANWNAIANEAETGNPVTISTPGHYYFADGYNRNTGQFHVGRSGTDLRQGKEWMTAREMETVMGGLQGALFADNPTVAAKSTAAGGAGGTQTTAGLSGGGDLAGQVGERGQQILAGAAQAADWLGTEGQKALQAVLVTEGGLSGARGDQGKSAGPLQFFGEEGGRAGQLNAFAQALGVSLEQARQYATDHPLEAVQWAVGSLLVPGYLGSVIGQGVAQGLTGPALATYVQQHGQVSVSPERAGEVWQRLFGGGQGPTTAAPAPTGEPSLLTRVGQAGMQQASDLAAQGRAGAERLAGQTSSALQAAQAQSQQLMADLDRSRSDFARQGEQYRSGLMGQREQTRADIMAPRQFSAVQDLAESGLGQAALQAPLPPLGGQSIGGVLQAAQQAPENVGRLVGALEPTEQRARRGVEEGFLTQAAVEPARMVARAGGRELSPEAEEFLRGFGRSPLAVGIQSDPGGIAATYLKASGIAPPTITVPVPGVGNVPIADFIGLGVNLIIPTGAESRFGTGALRTGLTETSRLGRPLQQWGAALAAEQGLGRAGRAVVDQATASRLAVSAIGRWARASVDDIAQDLLRSPAGEFFRSEAGELNVDALRQAATSIKQHMVRLYHGTAAAFDRPSPERFDEQGLFGPGYYLTSEPRVAGGLVATGGEQVGPSWLASSVKRAPGEVISEGYAQPRGESMDDLRMRWQSLQEAADRVGTPPEQRLSFDQWLEHQPPPAAGPNVRAVDVPQNMNLLDADRYLHAEDVAAIRSVLPANRAETFDRQVARAFEGRPTGQQVFDALTATFGRGTGAKAATNHVLAEAGFDGITYAGGKRIPMADEAGRDIQHQASVIFPESLDKIRNAISGRQGGQIDPRYALNVTGAVAGAGSQEATMTEEEKANPFVRVSRDISGALLGGAAPNLAISGARGIAATATGRTPSLNELGQIRQTLGARQMNIPGTAGQRMTPGELISALGKQNLLFGVKQHVTNIGSQLAELARTPARAALAGQGDQALLAMRAGVHGIPDALREFAQTWQSGISSTSAPGQRTQAWLPVFRFLGATDDFFRVLGAHMGMATEAQRLVNETGAKTPAEIRQVLQQNQQKILQAGQKEGAASVFQTMGAQGAAQTDPFSRWKNGLLGAVAQSPTWQGHLKAYGKQGLGLLVDALVPFAGMPARLWDIGLGRIPGVGEVRRLGELGAAIRSGDKAAQQRALGELGMQSVISSVILTQTFAGNVRGPDDPDHPNSALIGGNWVDYSGWGAFQLPLAMPAAAMDEWRKSGNRLGAGDRDYLGAVVNSAMKTMSNAYYLNSVFDLVNSIGQGGFTGQLSKTVASYTDRSIPSGFNQVEQMIDENVREVSKEFPQSVVDRWKSRVPYLAETLPAQVEPTTGGAKAREKQGPVGTLLGVETYQQAPIEKEIFRLNRLGYALRPPSANPQTISVNGAQIRLQPDEQRALGQARGQQLERVVGARMASSYWGTLTDDQRARLISRALDQAAAHNVVTWRRMTPIPEQRERIARGQQVVGRLTEQGQFGGGFTAPSTAA